MLGLVRIAAVVMEQYPSAIYRTWVPMQALAYRGHSVHIEERNVVENTAPLFEADVVHFCRCWWGHNERLARRLKERGIAIVWDNDDDFTTVPAEWSGYEGIRGLNGQRLSSSIRSMMRLADVVTAPSEQLAQRYRAVSGAEVRVLENYLPPTFVRPVRGGMHHGITVGCHLTEEHASDFDRLRMRETLERLLARHIALNVVSIGMNLGVRSHRYTAQPYVLYGDLPGVLACIDVGIAPMADTELNRCRSNVKLKEYAGLGVPWLASPVGAYAELGEGQGGRLVADDDWYHAIEQIVLNNDDRSRLAHRARRWAEEERIEAHAERWEEMLGEAIERTRSRAVR
jgi:Glycosyl transferases group 1